MSKFNLNEDDFLLPIETMEIQEPINNEPKIKEIKEIKNVKKIEQKKKENIEVDLAKIFKQEIDKGANNPRTSFIVSPFQLEVLKIVAYHKRTEAGVSGLLREAVNDYFIKIKKDPIISKRVIEDIKNLLNNK